MAALSHLCLCSSLAFTRCSPRSDAGKDPPMQGNALAQEELIPGEVTQSEPVIQSPAEKSKASIALDQWRGFALLLVLVSHGFFFTNMVNGIGRIGVNIFFFISGILVFRSLNTSLGAPQTIARA